MANMSASQIYQVALQAGFPPDRAVTWTAIAMAESGGNPEAHAGTGEDSWGLWQINVRPGVRTNTYGDLTDPLVNARAAFEISAGGTNLQPWSVTHAEHRGTARDYRTYLDEAEAARHQVGDDVPGGGGGGDGPFQPISDAELFDSWGFPRSGGRSHEGIDIMADEGTPIRAIVGGELVRGFHNEFGGEVVRLQGDDGRFYYYAHLQEGSTDHLEVGQRVEAGTVIGGVGDTGNAKGGPMHLHLGIQEGGEWINPYDFLQGVPDYEDAGGMIMAAALDSDGDGLADVDEIDRGSDPALPDTDADGVLDGHEAMYGTDATKRDTDDDGLSDAFELLVSESDPLLADTDGDEVTDSVEVGAGSDPLRGTSTEATVVAAGAAVAVAAGDDGGPDADGDGLSDEYELSAGSDPEAVDSDLDGLSDAFEVSIGTSLTETDTDLDTVPDDVEVAMGLNPLSGDSDGDGFGDAIELSLDTDPLAFPDGSPADDPTLPDAGLGDGLTDDPFLLAGTEEHDHDHDHDHAFGDL